MSNSINLNSDISSSSICELISQLENIGSEKDKDNFIKNYSGLKEKISDTDQILKNDNIDEFVDKNISELFEILNHYEKKILNPNTITIGELNKISNLTKLIEKKINEEKINVIEIK